MGAEVSHVPATPADYNVFSITIRSPDKIRVADAPETVIDIIRTCISEYYDYHLQAEEIGIEGGRHFKLAGNPFAKSSGFELSVSSKFLFAKLLAKLFQIGWKPFLNSDLSRQFDNSTLFFHQCIPADREFSICCLSPSHNDKFQLINASNTLYQVLLASVGNLLQNTEEFEGTLFTVKMHGCLWDGESTTARALMLNIFRNFRIAGFSFFGSMNFKGTADSIFFINDGSTLPPEDYCVISLNQKDRLRLVECPPELVDVMADAVANKWHGGLQGQFRDETFAEFKMGGYPWRAWDREDAVLSRLFVAEILETSVANGWAVLTALDICRSADDKAIFVMRQCTPMRIPHFCIAPSEDDRIRIIGADANMKEILADIIRQCWTPGIQAETIGVAEDHELKLAGRPWGGACVLARIMMTRILTSLETLGWSVICSADVSAKYINVRHGNSRHDEIPADTHAWFVAQTSLLTVPQCHASAPAASLDDNSAPPSYEEATRT